MPDARVPDVPNRGRSREGWLPILVLVVTAAVFVLLGLAVERAKHQRYRVETEVTAEQVRLRLEAWIDSRIAVVEHLSAEWPKEFAGHPNRYRATAGRFLRLYPGFQALNWIDSTWVIRIIVPEVSNEPALGRDLHHHPSRGVAAALQRAVVTRRITRSPVIDLLQGGKGFTTYRPLYDEYGRPLGFLNGVFRIDTLVDACLAEPHLRRGFRFDLVDEIGQVAYQHEASRHGRWPYEIHVPVRIVDRPWTLRFAPSAAQVQQGWVTAGELLIALGLLLTVVLAVLLRAFLSRERALRESEAKYKLLVENQTDMVVKTDEQGRFLFVSPSFCTAFGKREGDLLGREFLPLVHEEDRERVVRVLSALGNPPYSAYVEHRALTPDGVRWQGWMNTAVRDARGNVTAVIGVGRDITERRELEERLSQSQKLQAIGQLAGGVAHDFNNILQAILGYLGLAMERVSADEKAVRDLRQVEKAARRAAALTRQLLAFGRRQILQPVDMDLNRVVEGTIEMLRRVIGENIQVRFDPGPSPNQVHADPHQMEQILMNLCLNARDAMPDGGEIRLQARTTTVEEEYCSTHPGAKPGRWVLLRVADTGRGMTEETQARIFDPFFTTKEVGKGTGLGLSTVYGIVEQHGGWIEVDSEPGKGTEFRIYLPAAQGPVTEPAFRQEGAARGGNETLLLAEDEEMVRDVAARILRQAGYRVLAAADGIEAQRVFREHASEISLVLLDAVMPGASGAEVYENLRRVKPGIRVLFTSGYGTESLPPGSREAARVGVLQKPYDGDTLLRKVRSLLDESRDMAPETG